MEIVLYEKQITDIDQIIENMNWTIKSENALKKVE